MMKRVLKDISYHVFGGPDHISTSISVSCHHNYVSQEDTEFGHSLVTRKGAVSAKFGELGIIPGSMGQKSYIVKGKGSQIPISLAPTERVEG
jgi:tRNA-splicing ligase RtcB (3'-phosphate/5'-hydroxy nucleic acid ligase)